MIINVLYSMLGKKNQISPIITKLSAFRFLKILSFYVVVLFTLSYKSNKLNDFVFIEIRSLHELFIYLYNRVIFIF